jgi:hypothetical protein
MALLATRTDRSELENLAAHLRQCAADGDMTYLSPDMVALSLKILRRQLFVLACNAESGAQVMTGRSPMAGRSKFNKASQT